ncbi:MAG: ATP-binding cassette domain-containing protein [Clostridia bacterium]|nr:ATP-binding cassette domain-containing protein [Clostridia bacterium]
MPETAYIKVNGLSKSFDGENVISGLNFTFDDPGIYVIEGESGSGKTTLLRMIAGLTAPDGGSIETRGRIGVVFQEPRLFENVSLLENVKLVADKNSGEPFGTPEELLTAVGLGDSLGKTAAESSGGMCQRTSICRAIYFAPDILLCDEPFSAIDDANASLSAALLERFSETGILIIATHGGKSPFKTAKAVIVL